MSAFDFNFKDIIDEANDVIVVTKAEPIDSPGPEIVYVNKAFTQLTGYSREESIGKNPRMLQSEDANPETRAKIREALIRQEAVRVTIKNYSKFGKAYWLDLSILPLKNAAGEVTHFAAIERDVTESKELELELDQLSRHDPLSGLLNRRAFDEVAEAELVQFLETDCAFSVLALDIDHFKAVNDTYGHSVGDQAIQRVAETCRSVIGDKGIVARTGGEEFTILLPDSNAQQAKQLAEALRQQVAEIQLNTDLGPLSFTISIGIAEVSITDNTVSKTLVRADNALYDAKRNGRNRVCVYETSSEASAELFA